MKVKLAVDLPDHWWTLYSLGHWSNEKNVCQWFGRPGFNPRSGPTKLSQVVSTTIFKVFGMMRPGIEPRTPGPLANILLTRSMSRLNKQIDWFPLQITWQAKTVIYFWLFHCNFHQKCIPVIKCVTKFAASKGFKYLCSFLLSCQNSFPKYIPQIKNFKSE